MSATSASRTRPAVIPPADVPAVGPREPCPCHSGRRYKACHGRARAHAAQQPVARRPFAGRPWETDLVALREVVPSATIALHPAGHDGPVYLGTVLPVAWPAMVRLDGRVLVGLQTAPRSGDVDRDYGQALAVALGSEPGRGLDDLGLPGDEPTLSAQLPDTPLDVVVHTGFDWWLEGVENPGEEATAALEQANAGVVPTVRLGSVDAAYWCRIGERTHLRWAMPQEEEPLLDALARLSAARALDLGPDTRYVGAFRALGVVIPVWDLPADSEAAGVEEPAVALRARLDEALAQTGPLSADERRARAGVVSRQLTLR